MTPLISSRAGGKDDFGFADAEVEVPAESKEGRRIVLEFRIDIRMRDGDVGATSIYRW